MTLQELRYLVALAEHGHFGRAARACHVSQPSLSAALKRLEDELGVLLFERGPRGVLATATGERVVSQARRVLRESERLRELAREPREPLGGIVRLGAIPTVGPYLVPRLVQGLREHYPRLELHLQEQQTAVLLSELRQGKVDMAILSPPVDDHGLARADLYREDFLLATPEGHALAGKDRVHQEEVAGEALLLLDEGHCLRDQVLEVCRSGDSAARELLRGSSLETLRSMVAAGVGCTLLPALALDPMGGAVRLEIRPFEAPAPYRVISLYWRKGSVLEASAMELTSWIRRYLPDEVQAA
jgi:LysR family hydrogen peroxide-inducible transcriptional activator